MSVLASCSTAFCLLTMATVAQLATAQLENVALGKPAESSRLLTSSFLPGVAVDGVTDNDTQCMETAQYDRNPYWRVDLGHNYTVSNITLYRPAFYSIRMEGVEIVVDGQLCHTIDHEEAFTTEPSPGPPVAISVQCSTPLTGRHVTLVKNFTGDITVYHPEVLSLCEVQVWVSQPATTTYTTTTSSDNSGSTSVFRDQFRALPPETATTAGVVGGVVGGVLGSLLLLSLTVIVVLVVRMKRRREQNRGDNRQPDCGDTDTDTAGTGQINTATLPSVAEDAERKEDPVSTAEDDYDVIRDSGHYYDPLSYRDNSYIDDNTLYSSPVFTSSNNDNNDNNDSGGNGGDVHHYSNDVEK